MGPRFIRCTASTAFFALAAVPSAWPQCQSWSTRFGEGGPNSDIVALATFDDGSGPALFVGGYFQLIDEMPARGIARWDGTSWSEVGGGVFAQYYGDSVRQLIVFDDGSGPALFAGGLFTEAGGTPALNIAKWNGTTWSALGGGVGSLDEPVTDLAVFDDGSGAALYASIEFEGLGGGCFTQSSRVKRWDGTTWTDVGAATDCRINALEVFDDGSGPALYAGGSFYVPINHLVANVSRWDGANWSPVGTGLGHTDSVFSDVFDLVSGDDGSGPGLFAAGAFLTSHGSIADGVAKWNGTSWSPLPGLTVNQLAVSVRVLRFIDDGSGTALFAGGSISSPGGGGLAKWNGSGWSAPGGGVTGIAWALAAFDDGSGPALQVGGGFTHAGGERATNLASWNGSTWSHPPVPPGGTNATVNALHSFNDGKGPALYAGGSFTQAGGAPASRIARWDGFAWEALGQGTNNIVGALASFDDGSGPALYAGGSFMLAGGAPATRIAKWQSGAWSPLGTGLNDIVRAMVVFDDGSGPALYAVGHFTQAGGTPANRIAKWNGAGWSALGSGLNDWTFCLAVFDNGTGPALYAGGRFTQAGGMPANHVARWDGSTWSAVGNGLGSNVQALAVFDNGQGAALHAAAGLIARWNGANWVTVGTAVSGGGFQALLAFDDGQGPALYVGGNFSDIDSTNAQSIARWDGAAWNSLNGSLDMYPDQVNALAVFDDSREGGPDLFLGGSFDSTWDGKSCDNIAEWYGCARPGTMFCFGDGTIIPCPCGNNGIPARGCQNSAGTGGARLTTSGHLDPDTVVLHVSNELPNALTIFLQGNARVGPLAFGDGLRCAGGALKRLYVKSASAGAVSAPERGDLSITARSAAAGDTIVHGTARYYHTYYRDPNLSFCPAPQGSTFNSSNGVEIDW